MFGREESAGKRGKSVASDRFVASAVESPDQCVPNDPGDTSAALDLDGVFRSRVPCVRGLKSHVRHGAVAKSQAILLTLMRYRNWRNLALTRQCQLTRSLR